MARLNLPNMHYLPTSRLAVYAGAVRGLFELETYPERQLKYLYFFDIYADLNDNEMKQYQREYPGEAKKMSALGIDVMYIKSGYLSGIKVWGKHFTILGL
ncbi:MAG: hypothetical protein GY934_10810 [Gammaproteobacteria bacterium]|nr:hypothetical protein [Gammaproteobacteria bacterium]